MFVIWLLKQRLIIPDHMPSLRFGEAKKGSVTQFHISDLVTKQTTIQLNLMLFLSSVTKTEGQGPDQVPC